MSNFVVFMLWEVWGNVPVAIFLDTVDSAESDNGFSRMRQMNWNPPQTPVSSDVSREKFKLNTIKYFICWFIFNKLQSKFHSGDTCHSCKGVLEKKFQGNSQRCSMVRDSRKTTVRRPKRELHVEKENIYWNLLKIKNEIVQCRIWAPLQWHSLRV